jgi:hypothetical protein
MTRLINLFSIIAIIAIIGILGCDKDSTESDSINCNDLSISNNAPYYPFECSGTFHGTTSNIQYDQYGRRISWDFEMSCSSSNKTLEGRYYNMTYNEYGQLQTFDAIINGKHCSYP